jgi:hypothetical protein
MIEFRERVAQALLVHRLDRRTGARVKSGTINLDPAEFARSHHESVHEVADQTTFASAVLTYLLRGH